MENNANNTDNVQEVKFKEEKKGIFEKAKQLLKDAEIQESLKRGGMIIGGVALVAIPYFAGYAKGAAKVAEVFMKGMVEVADIVAKSAEVAVKTAEVVNDIK